MIVGLGKHARAGKDSAAAYLVENHGFTRVAFADKLKDLAYELNPVVGQLPTVKLQELVDERGWELAKEFPGVRPYLQRLGASIRYHLGTNAWVDAALMPLDLTMESEAGYWNGYRVADDIVITDVRYPNEARAIHDLGGIVIEIQRPGFGPVNDHDSETSDVSPDYVIQNDSTIEWLGGVIFQAIQYEKEAA